VALTLPAEATRDLEAEGRFEREARALAALNHPRVCTLFEFTRLNGHALLIMEHLEGQSLAERLARGRLPQDEACASAPRSPTALPLRIAPASSIVPTDGGKPTVGGGAWLTPSTVRISPDGRWLAFASTQSGQLQVYVSPVPATGEQRQIAASGGEHPQWRGDGRELFFIAPDGSMMAAAITPGPTFDFAAPRVLFKTALTADLSSQRFVATADGTRFLFNMLLDGDRAATTTTLHVVLNWAKGLPR
jgi:hypothetical protein